jgi:hypothetical protein
VPTKPLAFKARDVARAVKAARLAGLDPVSVEVDPHTGKIKILGKAAANQINELDAELAKFEARHHGQA